MTEINVMALLVASLAIGLAIVSICSVITTLIVRRELKREHKND